MQFRLFAVVFLFLASLSRPAFADYEGGDIFPLASVSRLEYGIDTDRVRLVALLSYPNSCYLPFKNQVKVDEGLGQIVLAHGVTIHKGMCSQVLVEKTTSFELENLRLGEYRLLDAVEGRFLGVLIVDEGLVVFMVPVAPM